MTLDEVHSKTACHGGIRSVTGQYHTGNLDQRDRQMMTWGPSAGVIMRTQTLPVKSCGRMCLMDQEVRSKETQNG